ncbi:Protein CURLY FLAG LEAF 2 [Cardamine amara subsp. amara]|uniref:Protein CURLY FLAG LEAF 2 n=1 Tax=Cardamine amara subsp. amara TaxID=228776 RepID=A0ABD1AHB3_CARAN
MSAANHDIGESKGTECFEEDSSYYDSEDSSSEEEDVEVEEKEEEEEDVLVVAGCKACLMYFMVPKLVDECPKCAAQLLHFDRPHSGCP